MYRVEREERGLAYNYILSRYICRHTKNDIFGELDFCR